MAQVMVKEHEVLSIAGLTEQLAKMEVPFIRLPNPKNPAGCVIRYKVKTSHYNRTMTYYFDVNGLCQGTLVVPRNKTNGRRI